MTPTPEEVALAERVGEKIAQMALDRGVNPLTEKLVLDVTKTAALTAIMEVREMVANLVLLEMVQEPDNEIDTTCNALVSDLYCAIRNGEHLR